MADFPDESLDMIWTDPPFGHSNHDGDWNARLNDHRGIEQKPILNDSGEDMRRVLDGMLKQAARVLKHDCCCCCCCCCGGGGPKPTFAWVANRMDNDGMQFFHSVIWDKINPGLGWRYRRQHEMVMVAHRTGGKLAWADPDVAQGNIIRLAAPYGGEREHPNEKPLGLVLRMVKLHTTIGQMVCDPFMGSGTTGVACAKTGRKFIGIELDETYFDIACKRVEAAYRQPDLFIEPPVKHVQEQLL
jgi:site-specific DNA-methyltransferase (adenine-specific)